MGRYAGMRSSAEGGRRSSAEVSKDMRWTWKSPIDEKADSIGLPKETGDVISIIFSNDKNKSLDALCVLSEGHLRCLGLAILISKNIKEGCPALFFDDVVNAIDTDHRSGINDLLFNHPPLREKQIIVTTHDEDFANRLASKISAEEADVLLQIYSFNMDEISRKINIDQDTRNLLQKSLKELSNGKIKDALKTGRQALENIGDELWRKLTKNQRVLVGINFPGAKPELHELVTKLKSVIKKENIEKYSATLEHFEFLLKKENWDYINIASHEGGDEPILDPVVAKNILYKLTLLDSIIKTKSESKKNQKSDGETSATGQMTLL